MKNKFNFILIFLFALQFSYRIDNCKCQWIQTSVPNGGIVYSIINHGTTYFAGTYNGIYKSTNSGNNWILTPLNNFPIRSLNTSLNIIYAGTTDGVYRSTDLGNNWNHFAFYLTVPAITISGSNILLGTDYNGIYRSLNNGYNWNQTSLNNKLVNSIVIRDSTAFAGTHGCGIYRSTNSGINWIQTTINNNNINSIAINGNYIFAGADNAGIYISSNNGNSWTQVQLNNFSVYSISVYNNKIFAGTSNGMYLSQNNGANWIQKNQGFGSTPTIYSILIVNYYVFAGTSNKVWKRLYTEIIDVKEINSEVPKEYKLNQNYPNPFNQNTLIKFQCSKSAQVELKIYNLLGREIDVLINEKLKPGTYQVSYDAGNLASGIYYYNLVTDEFSDTKKMIILK